MGGVHDDQTGEYQTPFLANLLHSLPHLNVSLHIVNSTFAPQSEVYLESLGILASVPAAWLIITLGILLAYLATRCCDNSGRRKPRALTAPRLLLAATALLCAAATGLGLYANDDLHNGLVQTFMAARMLDDIVANIRNQTKTISYSLTEAVSPQLTELSDIFDSPVTNTTAQEILFGQLQTVRQNHSLAVRATADIQRPLASLDARPIIELSERWELYRWAAAMGVLSGLLALCAVVVVGAARRSRRCLVAASVLALVSAAAAWLLASIGLAAAVALADLCVAPEQYASSVVAQRGLQPELLRYYTHCEAARVNPFTQRLREAQNAVGRMRNGINGMTRVAIPLFRGRDLQPKLSALTTEVNAIDRALASLTALLDCRGAHAHWVNGTKGLCTSALPGLALLLLATATAGLLLSVLVCLASHVWIYVRKRHDYSQVDEADPFIPATAASQAIAARTLQPGTLPRGIPASAPPHHHRSQGSYNSTSYDPPPSYAQAAQMHEKAIEDVHNPSDTSPNPYMFFDNDNVDGCDGASSRHTLGRDGLTGGGHLAHLGRSGHATLGRLPSHSTHHDHINLTGPNNDDPPDPSYFTLSSQHRKKRRQDSSGTLRSTISTTSSTYACVEDPNKPSKIDLLTSKARGCVYNSTVGISSNTYGDSRRTEETLTRPSEPRTATLQKYSTLGRRPLPLTPDEIKQSKETPIPRVPDEMPLSAANLTQFRSLQRSSRGPVSNPSAQFGSLRRGVTVTGTPIPSMVVDTDRSTMPEAVYSNSESERQLYAVTEL